MQFYNVRVTGTHLIDYFRSICYKIEIVAAILNVVTYLCCHRNDVPISFKTFYTAQELYRIIGKNSWIKKKSINFLDKKHLRNG